MDTVHRLNMPLFIYLETNLILSLALGRENLINWLQSNDYLTSENRGLILYTLPSN